MITFQYSTQDDTISGGIRKYTRSPYSHVDIETPDGWLLGARSDVCAGVPAGVQKRPRGYAPFTAAHRVALQTTPDREQTFWEFAYAQLGKGYDTVAVIDLALDRTPNRDWRNPLMWFCSELAMRAKEVGKIVVELSSPFFWVSPRDDLMVVEALGGVTVQ